MQVLRERAERANRPLSAARINRSHVHFELMSMAAAPTLTGFNSARSPLVLLGIANPPCECRLEGLGNANRHFPNRDRRRNDVSILKFACTHGPRFLTGTVPPIS